jgi:hypothetical protein
LKEDVVSAARTLVTACRASGQRQEDFQNTISEGNETGGWGNPPKALRNVVLLRDVDTRWSSIFRMIDRVLELYEVFFLYLFLQEYSSTLVLQAIEEFLMKPKHQEISHHVLSDMALHVLDDIRTFLHVPHIVQEIVSAEKTLTLSIVLPIYEKLIIMLKNLQAQLPEIAHAINASMEKLEEYLAYSRRTKIYVLAMGISFFLFQLSCSFINLSSPQPYHQV